MFEDYTTLVLQYYNQKMAANQLPLNLKNPKRARLKNECGVVCKERWQRKDEKTLRDFFEKTGDYTTYPRIIKHFPTDKFRPLLNFLKNPNIKTDEKNVELLAWLIDFEPRPFELGRTYDLEKNNALPPIFTGGPMPPTEPRSIISKIRAVILKSLTKAIPHSKVITIPIAAMVFTSATIPVYKYMRDFFLSECMYWTVDHYQCTPCDQKIYGSLVIPLDKEKLLYFKKITRPDTITEADINKVSYIRLNGDIEFYTRKGDHPVYTERTLKPLTEHMYQAHILPLKH